MNRTILALAWSLPDVQPNAKLSKSYAVRGEAPGAWELCSSCDGSGLDRYRRPCHACIGAGRYRIDPITHQRVGGHDSAAAAPRTAPCDRCAGAGVIPRLWLLRTGQDRTAGEGLGTHPPRIRDRSVSPTHDEPLVRCPPCDGTGRRDVPRTSNPPPTHVLDDGSALARLRALGSWGELETALEQLKRTDRAAWSTWVSSRVGGTPPNRGGAGSCPPPPEVSRPVSDFGSSISHLPDGLRVDGLGVGGVRYPNHRAAVSAVDSWLLSLPVVWRCPASVLAAYEAAGERRGRAESVRQSRVFRSGVARRVRIRELAEAGLEVASIAKDLGVHRNTVSRALAA